MRVKPKKRLGQNFLFDRNILLKMIRAGDFGPEDKVLEIGSGRGDLTRLIAAQGSEILTVEIDKDLIPILETNLAGYKNIKVLHNDILNLNLDLIFKSCRGKIKVIGNIPYNITTPIIQHLFKFRLKIKTIFLTVQKEFAKRIAALPGSKEYGSFSCFVQYHALPEILFTIKKGSFFPSPKVDSCFIRLEIRTHSLVKVKDEESLFKVIRHAFNQRRKTLRNSLKGIVPMKKLDLFFEQSRLSSNIRPEDLSLEDFAILADS